MKDRGPRLCPLSAAHLVCLGAWQLAAGLAFLDARLFVVPLSAFLLLCLAAPFFPRLGFYLPSVSRGSRTDRSVSLTFDDGPDPSLTPALLDLLKEHGVRATFFVVGEKAQRNPDIVRRILAEGHALGNHSLSHDPFLMLRSASRLRSEIRGAQEVLARTGVRPLAFRPPVGIVNPRLWRPLLEEGLFCALFSLRPGDWGNRRIKNLAARVLKKLRAGDIVLLHDAVPGPSFDRELWLGEMRNILSGISQKGYGIIPLEALIGRPVMVPAGDGKAGPVSAFYDAIAAGYDEEQKADLQGPARTAEAALFNARFDRVFTPGSRVLEFGSGTGNFSLPIAARCASLTAVEISPRMQEIHGKKIPHGQAGRTRLVLSDIESWEPDMEYDVICSFSGLEYAGDLASLLKKSAAHLSQGGILYCITARSSLPRFFVKLGNALRQGIWLRSYTRTGMNRALRSAGLVPVSLPANPRLSFLGKWLILEVMASKIAPTA